MNVRRGFTLIELLVVIAIIAVLAAILFPVFARAREKARMSTCQSNQRQIAAAVQMFSQDHEESLPTSGTVWADINVDAGVQVCPTAGKKVPIGYIYNDKLSGAAIGELADPSAVFITADGKDEKIDRRHSNQLVMSYLDGHVNSAQDVGQLKLVGELEKACASNQAPTAPYPNPDFAYAPAPTLLVYNPGKLSEKQPVINLSSYIGSSGYIAKKGLEMSSVGASGYVIFNSLTLDTSTMRYPYTSMSLGSANGGSWGVTYPKVQTSDANGPLEPMLQPFGGAKSDTWLRALACDAAITTVKVDFAGYNRIVTVICPKMSNGGNSFVFTAANDTQTIPVIEVLYGSSNTLAKIYQFNVPSGPVTFTIKGGISAGPYNSRTYPIRAPGVSAIFLDR